MMCGGTNSKNVVTLRLMPGSTFRFAFRQLDYKFSIQKIEKKGVRVRILQLSLLVFSRRNGAVALECGGATAVTNCGSCPSNCAMDEPV